jgi:hypothetical protein
MDGARSGLPGTPLTTTSTKALAALPAPTPSPSGFPARPDSSYPGAWAHTLSERRIKERLKELDPKGWRERQERPVREARHAKRIVALWNKRALADRPASFYPTVKTALLAGTAVLEVLCPACQTIGTVDLRTLDLHPGMAISGLIPRLSCRMCCPNPPFAKLVGLRPGPPTWRDAQ